MDRGMEMEGVELFTVLVIDMGIVGLLFLKLSKEIDLLNSLEPDYQYVFRSGEEGNINAGQRKE